jgi:hypothetical protein
MVVVPKDLFTGLLLIQLQPEQLTFNPNASESFKIVTFHFFILPRTTLNSLGTQGFTAEPNCIQTPPLSSK